MTNSNKCCGCLGRCGICDPPARFGHMASDGSIGVAGSRVGEIYLDFAGGIVSGDISDCGASEVADALERIVAFIRSEPGKLDYVDFDEGKISASSSD